MNNKIDDAQLTQARAALWGLERVRAKNLQNLAAERLVKQCQLQEEVNELHGLITRLRDRLVSQQNVIQRLNQRLDRANRVGKYYGISRGDADYAEYIMNWRGE